VDAEGVLDVQSWMIASVGGSEDNVGSRQRTHAERCSAPKHPGRGGAKVSDTSSTGACRREGERNGTASVLCFRRGQR
jgi:hypothetical protein